jgi:Family of unknown function (DUF6011)
MNDTAALRTEYARVITAKFTTKRDGTPMHCITCNTPLVQGTALAAVADGSRDWHSYCPQCAADPAVQIRGLFGRLLQMGTPIPEAISNLVRGFLADETTATFLAAKRGLMTLRSEAGREAAAERAANGLDLTVLPAGKYAVPGGDTRLKVRIDAPKSGKWDGWVFVKDAAAYGEGKRYGSQRPGATYKGQIEDALRAIVADPTAAMFTYGQITGTCCFCALPLEKAESVRRGYGPTCADNNGLPFDHAAYNAE